jgi:hypothetical protein
LPEESAVAVAFAAPLKVTVVPLPVVAGVIAPVILNVCAVAVKAVAVTLPPFTVTFWLAGENVNPVLLGVRV